MFKVTYERSYLVPPSSRHKCSTVLPSTPSLHAWLEKENKHEDRKLAPLEIQPGYEPSSKDELWPNEVDLGPILPTWSRSPSKAIGHPTQADDIELALQGAGLPGVYVNDCDKAGPQSLQEHKHPGT